MPLRISGNNRKRQAQSIVGARQYLCKSLKFEGDSMIVYLMVSILVICVSLFPFFEKVVVNWMSLLPVMLVLLSFVQAMIFKSYANADGEDLATDNTAYSFSETDKTAYRSGMKWHYICKMVAIPLLLLFAIYFSSPYKIILPILIYALSYMPVKFLVKIEQSKKKE